MINQGGNNWHVGPCYSQHLNLHSVKTQVSVLKFKRWKILGIKPVRHFRNFRVRSGVYKVQHECGSDPKTGSCAKNPQDQAQGPLLAQRLNLNYVKNLGARYKIQTLEPISGILIFSLASFFNYCLSIFLYQTISSNTSLSCFFLVLHVFMYVCMHVHDLEDLPLQVPLPIAKSTLVG